MTTKAFDSVGYRSQVHRLTEAAHAAVKLYPLRVDAIRFLQHGENATFRVESDGSRYLLRIHRAVYHDRAALLEEARVLERVASGGVVRVPQHLPSSAGLLVETVATARLGVRHCSLMRWIDGRFVEKSISLVHARALGRATAELHRQTTSMKLRHRRYWHADGLVGADPKLGSVDALPWLRADDQRIVTAARRRTLAALRRYASRFPERLGVVHADIHFGNFLWRDGDVGLIDFDDCGWGFRAYDLAVTQWSIEGRLAQLKRSRETPAYIEALRAGYAERAPFDRHDERVLPAMLLARRISMLGWLHSRSDHPQLRARAPKATRRLLSHLRSLGD